VARIVLLPVAVFVELFDDVAVRVGASPTFTAVVVAAAATKKRKERSRILIDSGRFHLACSRSSPGCPVQSQSNTRPHSVRHTSLPSGPASFQIPMVSVCIFTGTFADS